MMMSNGIGATGGMIAAGAVINSYCKWEMTPSPSGNGMMRLFMGDWTMPWLIFAGYALLVGMLFFIFFRAPAENPAPEQAETVPSGVALATGSSGMAVAPSGMGLRMKMKRSPKKS